MQIQSIRILLLVFVIAATGCSKNLQRHKFVDGLSPVPDAKAVKVSTENQNEVFKQLLIRSQLGTAPGDGDVKWGQFVEAGFGFVDEQCEQYLDSLFWYNRFRNTTAKQLSVTGAATASVMGIVESSAAAIAVTAAAFGFTSASFDNLTGNVLYELEPSGVKSLVDRSKAAYRSVLGSRVDIRGTDSGRLFSATDSVARNRPEAMSLIQGYLALCLPTYIEAQVNNAVADTDFTKSQQQFSFVPSLTRQPVSFYDVMAKFKADADAAALKKQVKVLEIQLGLERVTRTPLSPNRISGAQSPQEEKISVIQGIAIQNALCVPSDAVFGQDTRAAIKMYQEFLFDPKKDGILRLTGQIAALAGMTSCDLTDLGEKNIFERMFFGENPEEVGDLQAMIDEQLKVLIAKPLTGLTVTKDDLIQQESGFSKKLDRQTRDAITILQKANGGGTIPTGMIEGQVTEQFFDILNNNIPGGIEEPPSNYSKKFHHFFPRGDMIGHYKNRVSLVQCPDEAGFDSCAIGNTVFRNMGPDNGRIVWAHPNRVPGVAGSVLVCKRNGVEFKFEVPEKDEFGECP